MYTKAVSLCAILSCLLWGISVETTFAITGDWIDDPFVLTSLPAFVTGNTCDFNQDVDWMCPTGGPAPDVVYRYVAEQDGILVVDLCGSDYDTKVFVTDFDVELLGCDDDFYAGDCGMYRSLLDDVPVTAGETYYIWIDGYFDCCGVYEAAIYLRDTCAVDLAPATVMEGEDEIQPGYLDLYNAGCGDDGEAVVQPLQGNETGLAIVAANSGWTGEAAGDQDWFLAVGLGQSVTVVIETEEPLWFIGTTLTDCDQSAVWEPVFVPPCEDSTLVIDVGEPGASLWIGIEPVGNYRPTTEWQFSYLMTVDGIAADVVSVESSTLSGVRSLFR